MMRLAWFFFWRSWWAASLNVVQLSMWLGLPSWLVNVLGPVAGTSYAWRMARLSGWSGRVK
jgi:hypothetical protein